MKELLKRYSELHNNIIFRMDMILNYQDMFMDEADINDLLTNLKEFEDISWEIKNINREPILVNKGVE